MDDILWWCDSREAAKAQLAAVREFAWQQRRLTLKDNHPGLCVELAFGVGTSPEDV